MKNNKRIDLRLTPETKEQLTKLAQNNGQNCSEYIRSLIEQAAYTNSSCQQPVYNKILQENRFINSLLTNPALTDDAKKIIVKEMRKYV